MKAGLGASLRQPAARCKTFSRGRNKVITLVVVQNKFRVTSYFPIQSTI